MTRKSRREIEATLEDIEQGPPGEYPTVDLALVLSCDWEPVDKERNLKRRQDTGEVYYFPEFEFGEQGES